MCLNTTSEAQWRKPCEEKAHGGAVTISQWEKTQERRRQKAKAHRALRTREWPQESRGCTAVVVRAWASERVR